MSLFRRKVKNETAGSAYMVPYGYTDAGALVTEKSSMQITAVNACVRLLSETIASLPLHVLEVDEENGGKKKATDNPLYFLLHDEPNPEMTSFTFRETMMTHLLLWGNAYAQIIRDGFGHVIALYPLMANQMKVDRRDTGEIYYRYYVSQKEKNNKSFQMVELDPYEVLHIPGLGFDGLQGYSPIAMARNAVGLGMAAEKFGSTFYNNGATPGGVIETPGTVTNKQEFRENWQKGFSGSNAHRVAVLEKGMKYVPISINPSDSQFIETRKFQLTEIARIFRVPPHMIGDLEKSSFSNIEQQSIEFVRYTLDPWIKRWEQGTKRALMTREQKQRLDIHFNVEGLLRGDMQSRYNGYAIGRQNGWLSANDVRELEDMNKIPAEQGGDDYQINGNMLKLDEAGAYANKAKGERNE